MPLIEPGSLVVGELKLVDERAALVEQLQVPRCAVCAVRMDTSEAKYALCS